MFRVIDDGDDETESFERTEFLYARGNPVGDVDWDVEDTKTTTIDKGDYNLVQNIGEDYPSSAVTTVEAVEGCGAHTREPSRVHQKSSRCSSASRMARARPTPTIA